ncbi:MAG: 16S rRNA processing protein RimM [Tannerella sp.]|jgi:16S rRNA processing protein RimM|nr:16S rRNA processing protein RimM [Tannerella sp.]
MIEKKDLRAVGRFTKPHGVKGEITLVTDFELPDSEEDTFIIVELDGVFVPFFMESWRTKNAGSVLVKFENMDSEREVKIFAGKSAYLLASMVEIDDENAVNQRDFTGFSITDSQRQWQGEVIDYDDSTANCLLKVMAEGRELIIPTAFISRMDAEKRELEVSLPDGLLEI